MKIDSLHITIVMYQKLLDPDYLQYNPDEPIDPPVNTTSNVPPYIRRYMVLILRRRMHLQTLHQLAQAIYQTINEIQQANRRLLEHINVQQQLQILASSQIQQTNLLMQYEQIEFKIDQLDAEIECIEMYLITHGITFPILLS